MADIVQVLAGLGVVTAVLGCLKYSFERRCWRQFKREANSWVNRQLELKARGFASAVEGDESPPGLTALEDDALTVVVEEMLSEAGFTPAQTQQLLKMAVVILRAIAADRFLT
jgi:hypothetical protein